MKKRSAGLLAYRKVNGQIEVLIAHMGGPFHAKKDDGHWSIPKGEYEEGEDPLEVAKREFEEELGQPVPAGKLIEIGTVEQHNNKQVTAWAVETDVDTSVIKSNTFSLEWPPRSGKMQEFPEIDRAEWVNISQAPGKVIRGQGEIFNLLAEKLGHKLDSKTSGSSQQSLL